MVRLEPKTAAEIRNFSFDWSDYLGPDDTIASADVSATGVTIDSDANDATSVDITVSGGVNGSIALITVTITTVGGLVESETFRLPIYAGEPITLAEAKAHLRVLDDSEDGLIESYVRAAREWVENETGHILVRRTIEQPFRDGFGSYFQLFHRPVVDVTGIGYTDADGVFQTLTDFAQTTGNYPFRVYPDARPSIRQNSMVTVSYVAGYAEGEEPQALIQAMLLLIGHWFNVREAVNVGNIVTDVPFAVQSLCDQYRVPVV